MSLILVKILLAITSIGMPIMIVIPKSDTLCYAFAAAVPAALFAFYRLIRCMTINETLNEIDRRRRRATSQEVTATAQSHRA